MQMNMHWLDLDLEGYEPKGWRLPMQREPRPRYLRAFPEPKRGVLKACNVYGMGAVARGGTLISAVVQRAKLSLVSTSKPPNGVNAAPEEYLTIAEVAGRLKWTPKTVRNKMAAGEFRQGVHYFRRKGLSARFKWGAVVAWVEEEATGTPEEDAIPMARGYRLGEPHKKTNFAGT